MAEPTAEHVCELVDAVKVFIVGANGFSVHDRCPYCEARDEQHLPFCQVAELKRKLLAKDWSGEPAEDCPDVRGLVLVVREIVFALDGFDPEFCKLSQPLVDLLKEKLIPFEAVK